MSVHQKFIEKNMIGFMAELLEEGQDYEDIEMTRHASGDKPKCELICLLSGQKDFNEFHNVFVVSPQSLIRVWFYQT